MKRILLAMILAGLAAPSAFAFNPQPDPPGKVLYLNPQPEPPGIYVMLNPQPLPPGAYVTINPQPLPPKTHKLKLN